LETFLKEHLGDRVVMDEVLAAAVVAGTAGELDSAAAALSRRLQASGVPEPKARVLEVLQEAARLFSPEASEQVRAVADPPAVDGNAGTFPG
jgi:hypothetical protein